LTNIQATPSAAFRGLALGVAVLLGSYLLLTSTVTLHETMWKFDVKRVLELCLFPLIFAAVLCSPMLRRAFREQLDRIPRWVVAVLLVLLVGIMEVGRMVTMYALVVNASRDAVRYASAVGLDDSGTQKYLNCTGIETAAQDSAYFVTLVSFSASNIQYDSGPGTTSLGTCQGGGWANVVSGSRVTVKVEATYTPLIRLLPISARTISATSSRTILGIFDLEN
jgi:hypothetical protein